MPATATARTPAPPPSKQAAEITKIVQDETEYYNFGLAVVRQGSWLLQPPLLSGIGSVEAYLPSEMIAIAVAVTLEPEFFQSGPEVPSNPAKAIFEQIGAYLAPDDVPPVRSGASS